MNTILTTSDFYYDLPKRLIAQDPLDNRSSSRLLVMDRKTGELTHTVFSEIIVKVTCLQYCVHTPYSA